MVVIVKKKDPAAVALGRKGGKKGGPARAAKLTPEQRSDSARKAVQARWSKTVTPVLDTSKKALHLCLKRIKDAPPLSTLVEKMPIEDVVTTVLQGCDYKQIDPSFNVPLSYTCQCSRERALAPLALFSEDERQEMIDQGGTEVICQFCGHKYRFSSGDLLALIHDGELHA